MRSLWKRHELLQVSKGTAQEKLRVSSNEAGLLRIQWVNSPQTYYLAEK